MRSPAGAWRWYWPLYGYFALLWCAALLFPDAYVQVFALSSRAIAGGAPGGNVPVLTYKYDNQRTGENTDEQLLSVANVNTQQFGPLMTYPVDGQVYAQPLYLPDVSIGGRTYDLAIVATEHDSVYAFDADRAGNDTTPLWHTSFLGPGMDPVPASAQQCNDLHPQLGITSTPVIDDASKTLFVVAYIEKHGRALYELHALDLLTGHEKSGSPVQISLSSLKSVRERQRAGLLFVNGRVYFAFSSFCDNQPYHGGILSYSYDGRAFRLLAAYNDTPDGSEGGIWSTGSALAADEEGNIYAMSGNGTFDLATGGADAGDSFIKLNKGLRVIDYFTPFNQSCLAKTDSDLGSGGPLLLPGNELIGGGKEGRIYVLDTRHMGHYRPLANACARRELTTIDRVLQETAPHTVHAIFSTPAYWRGPDAEYIFVASVKDHTRAFKLTNGRLSDTVSETPEIFAYSGGDPVVSSNGTTPGTGILWLITAPGALHAYDATNLSHELYSNTFGNYNKFATPVVTNGKVLVATQNALKIYGLLAQKTVPGPVPQPTSSAFVPVAGSAKNRGLAW